jgi:uncharacterized membrane protein
MNYRIWCVIGLIALMCIPPTVLADDYAELTVEVEDIYGVPIDDARVSLTYVYQRPEDTDILDQLTDRGVTSFVLETNREYVVTVSKAGYLPFTELVELEEDTTVTAVLEYAQKLPIIHVRRYSVFPQEVEPGEQFRLQVVIENEGTSDALNVKIGVTPTQFFSPVQPSSSAYFNRLDVGDLTTVNLTFAVSGEALSGVYDLPLAISFKDAAGMVHTVQETVGVTILRVPMVKLLNIDFPREVQQSESFTFSLEIGNTGRFLVNGLYLEIESNMDWEYSSYYVGSLEAGDFDTFVSEVSASEPGDHAFTVRIGYVDDFNREHHEEYQYSVTVTETVSQTPPPQEKGFVERFIQWIKSFLGLN